MNKNLKISLSLLLFPIMAFCSEKSDKKITFISRPKESPAKIYNEKNSSEQEEKNSPAKRAENQTPDTTKVASFVTAQPTQTVPNLGTPYDTPTIITQDKEFIPGMSFGCDNKGIRESAASFVHRLINAGKLLDACSKPDKLQSKEPKINERITEALREINLRLNNEQKNAHASVSKLLTEQKSNFTQSTNSMLIILLTLKSIFISGVISSKDVETYNQNIQEEIDALRIEAEIFQKEKNAQIQHLQKIKEELTNHLAPISEKKESK